MLAPDRTIPTGTGEQLVRLIEVVSALRTTREDLALAEIEDRRIREDAMIANWQESIAGQNRAAEAASFASGQWASVRQIRAQVLDYEEERDLLRFLVDHATH